MPKLDVGLSLECPAFNLQFTVALSLISNGSSDLDFIAVLIAEAGRFFSSNPLPLLGLISIDWIFFFSV